MRWAALAAAAFVVPACGGGGSSGGGGAAPAPSAMVSWSADVWPVVAANCQTCHTVGLGSQMVPDMIMTDATATRNAWVGVNAACAGLPGGTQRVVAGDALTSFVYQKLSQTTPPCGSRMPFGLPPLSVADQMLFFDWINQGALDN